MLSQVAEGPMNSSAQSPAKAGAITLPWDLSEWVPKETLWAWIVEEVSSLDWGNPEVVDFLRANPGQRPKLLLCLIAFGYATEVWESAEIALRYEMEAMIRALDPAGPVAPATVARFRKENRALLKWVLIQLLKRVVRSRLSPGTGLLSPGIKRFIANAAAARIDIARHFERGLQGA
ncbi:MAG TPA: hypothetical protein VNO52_17935 [Methylomirabilota bacterium]|nr:hypothetical protein [Methylomirabilota bacterium]